jgi:hypothetical protein
MIEAGTTGARLCPFWSSFEAVGDLFARWKTTSRLLRERESAVDPNLEDAAT